VLATVYTLQYTMKKKQKPRKSPRKTILFGVWLPRDEKQRLEQISAKTGIDQSKLTRRALGLLFEAYNRGQLELGFPDSQPQARIGTQNAAL
jgi:Ribbon-helix-helix domain